MAEGAADLKRVMTSRAPLDEAIAVLQEHATEFARLAPGTKAVLLRQCLPRIAERDEEWVALGCLAKELPSRYAGEEWLAGPVAAARCWVEAAVRMSTGAAEST